LDKEIKEITNKHDKGYKRIFSRNRNFLYFLNKYIKSEEVAGWVKNIDTDDLVWINTELIDDKFKERDSDVIYRVKFKDKEIIFYVMLELQSTVDFSIPFRLLTYMTLILKYVFENTPKNEREVKGYRLPAVVPVILYNGADNWTAVRTFKEYLQGYEQFDYVVDINRMDNETILTTKQILDIIFMLDKQDSRSDVERSLGAAVEHFMNMNDEDSEDMVDWLKHIWLNHITDDKQKDELLEKFKKGEVTDMNSGLSIAFENERLKGEKIGRDEAEQKAHKEKLEIAKSLLGVLDTNTIAKKFKLTKAEIKKLEEKG
jgi:predicted transposase YdaD